MNFVGRSATGMMLLSVGALAYGIGIAFLGAAYLALTPSNLEMVSDLSHSSDWIRLIAAMIALVAVATAGKQVYQLGENLRDAVVTIIAALLIVLGLLVEAAAGETLTATGVITGLGIAVASLPVFARDERSAGAGIVLLAIGYAMSASATSTGAAVAAGLLEAAGAAVITYSVAALVHPGGYLRAAPGKPLWLRTLMAGLLLLIMGFIAQAFVSGVIYSGNASLTAIRTGPAVAYLLQFLGFAMLAAAAWAWLLHLSSRPR
jgi:hypothetical protein